MRKCEEKGKGGCLSDSDMMKKRVKKHLVDGRIEKKFWRALNTQEYVEIKENENLPKIRTKIIIEKMKDIFSPNQ